MKSQYKLIDPDDWGETFSPSFLSLWMSRNVAMMLSYSELAAKTGRRKDRLTSYDILSDLRLFMSRSKGKLTNANRTNATNNSKSSTEPRLVWANIRLDDEDTDILLKSELSFEYLSAYNAQLADLGWRVSIVRKDDGKSYSCTIIGPHPIRSDVLVGISSFGSTLHNTLLAHWYKLSQLLGGSLDDIDDYLEDNKQSRLFG